MAKKKTEQEPQYYVSAINTQVLNYNVYIMNAAQKLLFGLLTFIAGGLVGLIFYGGLFKSEGSATLLTYISNAVIFVLIGLLTRKIFYPIINESFRKRRLKKLNAQFRDFLDALSNALAGGMNVTDALNNVYNDLQSQYSPDAYIVQEVSEMVNGIQNNIAIEEILRDFGTRSGIEDISNFATVFETAYRTGGNLRDIIRRTTDIISEKIIINEEIQTKLTSNKMQMSIMNVIPIFLVLMMRLSSSQFAEAFSSIVGVVAMTIGIGFFLGAYKIGQKIMDIKG